MISRVGRPILSQTAFFLCDIQERFRPLIHNFETLTLNSQILVNASRLLEIPVIATEQYSKAFGHIIPEIEMGEDIPVFEKKKFSMMTEEVTQHFQTLNKDTVVLFGIETHVCVLQTCLELLERGDVTVHLVHDCVSSQRRFEREMAIERLVRAGAFVNSTEGILFQLMGL